MKRLLWLLLILALLLPAATLAEEPFYTIHVRQGGEDSVIGTAVVASRVDFATALLGGGYIPEGAEVYVTGPDGEVAVDTAIRLDVGDALMLVVDPAVGDDAEWLYWSENQTPVWFYGQQSDGTWVSCWAQRVTTVDEAGYPVTLVSLETELLPGAIGFNNVDTPVVILTASSAEGDEIWKGISSDTLSTALQSDDFSYIPIAGSMSLLEEPIVPETSGFVSGLTTELYDGVLLADWSEVDTSGFPEGFAWRLYVGDAANTYYSWITYEADHTYAIVDTVPGHSYQLWLRQIPGKDYRDEPRLTDRDAVAFTMPEPSPIDRYDYHEESQWVTMAMPGQYASDEEIPKVPLTLSGLEEQAAYLQVTSVYDVDEDFYEYLVLALTAPDGETYTTMSSFVYLSSLAVDVWNAEITDLLEEALVWNAPEGTWHLAWYYDGSLAGQTDFTIGE